MRTAFAIAFVPLLLLGTVLLISHPNDPPKPPSDRPRDPVAEAQANHPIECDRSE